MAKTTPKVGSKAFQEKARILLRENLRANGIEDFEDAAAKAGVGGTYKGFTQETFELAAGIQRRGGRKYVKKTSADINRYINETEK